MIHDAARRCIGWIGGGGAKPAGHAVLIGRSHAVTCAHVLHQGRERPTAPILLHFPNLGGLKVEATIPDWGWAPYDPDLAHGSDIAVLVLSDVTAVPDDAWARWDRQRPGHGVDVVTLEFLTARPDGDPRAGRVIDGAGHLISLDGQHFVTPGVSGSGLFPMAPGERLLGLISGRPLDPAHQTKGYAIPADAIAEIMARVPRSGSVEVLRPAIETLVAVAMAAVGDNLRVLLGSFADHVRSALRRRADTWREEDVQALAVLQLELDDALAGSTGDHAGTQSGFLAAVRWLGAVLGRIAAGGPDPGLPVPLDAQMADLLRQGLAEVRQLLDQGLCPEPARQSLDQLRAAIEAALSRERVRLGQLSAQADLARRRSQGVFSEGARALMACIGLRVSLAPPLAVFVECNEPWAPEMVVLSAGRFLMGAPAEEEGSTNDERPQREVQVPRFAIGRYAVTFAQWDAANAVDAGLHHPPDSDWGRADRPVINVSWDDAQAYRTWLNNRLGLANEDVGTYRLPTEAEWEYACRAGTATPFSFGSAITTDQANYDGKGTYGIGMRGVYRERTVPVGSLPANGWGLHEMHGNVWEWVLDVYRETYVEAPADGRSVGGPSNAPRVLRGGSWLNLPGSLRSAARFTLESNYRIFDVSFRLARTLSPLGP